MTADAWGRALRFDPMTLDAAPPSSPPDCSSSVGRRCLLASC